MTKAKLIPFHEALPQIIEELVNQLADEEIIIREKTGKRINVATGSFDRHKKENFSERSYALNGEIRDICEFSEQVIIPKEHLGSVIKMLTEVTEIIVERECDDQNFLKKAYLRVTFLVQNLKLRE